MSQIAITGLDGSGKSTQGALLQRSVLGQKHRAALIHHSSTKVPGLRLVKRRFHSAAIRVLKAKGIHSESGRDEQDDGMAREAEPDFANSSIARVIAAYLVVGSFLKAHWYKVRYRGRLTILDRCFLDDLVKAVWRFRSGTVEWKWLLNRAPRPRVLIVLRGDPSITFGRKKAANCTYSEYLAKSRALDAVLTSAAESGWHIESIPVDNRGVDDVHGDILNVATRYYANDT